MEVASRPSQSPSDDTPSTSHSRRNGRIRRTDRSALKPDGDRVRRRLAFLPGGAGGRTARPGGVPETRTDRGLHSTSLSRRPLLLRCRMCRPLRMPAAHWAPATWVALGTLVVAPIGADMDVSRAASP